MAGALVESDYAGKLRSAGFGDVTVEATRIYSRDDTAEMASSCCGGDLTPTLGALVEGADHECLHPRPREAMSRTRRLSLVDRYLPLWIALKFHVAFSGYAGEHSFSLRPAALSVDVRE